MDIFSNARKGKTGHRSLIEATTFTAGFGAEKSLLTFGGEPLELIFDIG